MPCVRRKYEKHSRNFMEARAALSNEPSEVDRERVGRYYHLMRNQAITLRQKLHSFSDFLRFPNWDECQQQALIEDSQFANEVGLIMRNDFQPVLSLRFSMVEFANTPFRELFELTEEDVERSRQALTESKGIHISEFFPERSLPHLTELLRLIMTMQACVPENLSMMSSMLTLKTKTPIHGMLSFRLYIVPDENWSHRRALLTFTPNVFSSLESCVRNLRSHAQARSKLASESPHPAPVPGSSPSSGSTVDSALLSVPFLRGSGLLSSPSLDADHTNSPALRGDVVDRREHHDHLRDAAPQWQKGTRPSSDETPEPRTKK